MTNASTSYHPATRADPEPSASDERETEALVALLRLASKDDWHVYSTDDDNWYACQVGGELIHDETAFGLAVKLGYVPAYPARAEPGASDGREPLEVWAIIDSKGRVLGAFKERESAEKQARYVTELSPMKPPCTYCRYVVPTSPARAEPAGGWVDCESRVPERGQAVLFWSRGWLRGAVFGLGRFLVDDDGRRQFEDETQQMDDGPRMYDAIEVTHWQPLPQAPQSQHPSDGERREP